MEDPHLAEEAEGLTGRERRTRFLSSRTESASFQIAIILELLEEASECLPRPSPSFYSEEGGQHFPPSPPYRLLVARSFLRHLPLLPLSSPLRKQIDAAKVVPPIHFSLAIEN